MLTRDELDIINDAVALVRSAHEKTGLSANHVSTLIVAAVYVVVSNNGGSPDELRADAVALINEEIVHGEPQPCDATVHSAVVLPFPCGRKL